MTHMIQQGTSTGHVPTTESETQAGSGCSVREHLAESEGVLLAPPSSEPLGFSRDTQELPGSVVTHAPSTAAAPMIAGLDEVKKTLAEIAAGQVCQLTFHESPQRAKTKVIRIIHRILRQDTVSHIEHQSKIS
jgi:hypothetical protein